MPTVDEILGPAPATSTKMPSVDDVLGAAPHTTITGLAASLGRGAAPYATGAALGAAIGAPFAGVGAVPGAIAGMGATALSELGGDIYNAIGAPFGHLTTPQEVTDRALDVAGVKRPATTTERIAETVGGVAPFGISAEGMLAPMATAAPEARRASEIVSRRLAQDAKAGGPTAEDALKAISEWRAKGKPLTLADVGGENIRSLAGHVGRTPGESREMAKTLLEGRHKDAATRLTADIAKHLSDQPTAFAATKALMQARSLAARPLYQEAESLQSIWSPRLQQFLEEPDVKKGLARGFRLERLDALAEGRPFDPTQLGVDIDAEGNVVLRRVPNLRVLDMGKRGLDAMIADERDPITGRMSALGRSLEKVRQSYVKELDSLDTSGVYRKAREAWGGPSRSIDSVKFGRTIFNRSPEETAAEFKDMLPNDQEFVRLGVADALRERLAKIGFGGNQARALIKNPWMREQLRPIFRSDKDFDQFADSVMTEHTMAETRNDVLKGSATAKRIAEDVSHGIGKYASAGEFLHHVFTGRPFAALRSWVRLRRDLGVGNNEKLNEEVAKLLFSGEPAFTGGAVAPTASPMLGRLFSTPKFYPLQTSRYGE